MNDKQQTPNKPLRDFQPGDLIYINKIKSGYSFAYLCNFITLKNGVVVAKIIQPERKEDRTEGIITARAFSCYAWSFDDKLKRNYCHWFRNGLDKAPS